MVKVLDSDQMKPDEYEKPKETRRSHSHSRCFSCSKWAETYLPTINLLDPNAPYINWSHCNIEKSFMFSVDTDFTVCGVVPSFCCKPFLIVANVWMTPWLIALNFFVIYLYPAVTEIVMRIVEKFLCALNIFSCGYTDAWFPPNDISIGTNEIRPHLIKHLDCWHRGLFYCFISPFYDCCCTSKVEWVRAGDLEIEAAEEGERDADSMKLFQGRIEPSDVCQGSLGDCWLVASLACVAERNEGLIKTLFLSRTASQCGYYKIRLYDVFNGPPRWRCFNIDDWIPVQKDTNIPMYTQPHGMELWVMLLEKAFAKMFGSYKALDGGGARVPFRAMTGNSPVEYRITGTKKDTKISPGNNPGIKDVPELNYQEAWHVFQGALQHNMIACAAHHERGRDHGKVTKEYTDERTGLVSNHMYSILDTCVTRTLENKEVKLIKLRNPWGSTEWKGAYSEHDEATKGWKPYGGFLIGTMFSHAQAVKDDGVFWMPFNDFLEQYDYICLCAVNQNMSSLHLNMCEEYGPCGPLCGCAEGAVTYCLMCKGVSHLWCSSSLSTVQLINSFKNGTSIERAQKCCEVAARATVNIIAPNSRFAKTPDEGDLF